MAKSIEEILGREINSVKELKEEIKRLQDELVKAKTDTSAWTETADKLTAAQLHLNQTMQAGKTTIDASEDSIVGMEQQYKSLYNTYRLMSKEMRETDFGKQTATQLAEISAELNSTKKNVGNFKDNIGRYAESASEAFAQMGISIGGMQGPLKLMNGSMGVLNKTMLANPVFWLIAAFKLLVNAFTKVKEAIAGNEETQRRLNQAMAAFQPIIDAVSNSFDALAQKVVTVIEWMAKAYQEAQLLWAKMQDIFSKDKGHAQRIKEQQELYNTLEKRRQQLVDMKRERDQLNASEQEQLNTLRAEAAAEQDKTKRLDKINKAIQLQNKITERNVKIAEEEYDIALETSKLTANDAETNEKLNQLLVEKNRVMAEGQQKLMELNSQTRELTAATQQLNQAQSGEDSFRRLEGITDLVLEYSEKVEGQRSLTVTQLQIEEARLENAKKLFYELEKADNLDFNWNEKFKEKGIFDDDRVKTMTDAILKIGILRSEVEKLKKTLVDDYLEEDANAVSAALDKEADLILAKEKEIAIAKAGIMDNETLSYQEKVDFIKDLEDELAEYKAERALYALENLELTTDQEKAYWEEYYNWRKQQEDELIEKQKEAAEQMKALSDLQVERNINVFDSAYGLVDSIGAIADGISQNIELTLEDEKISKDAAEKKKKQLKQLQDIQLGVTLALIAADTAAGIMGIWKGYAAEKVVNAETAAATGPAAAITLAGLEAKSLAMAILQTAAMGTMGAAQMAAAIAGNISAKKSIDGMGGGQSAAAGTVAAPAVIDTTPYSYTRQIQSTEEEALLNQPIWVSVVDIENEMNKVSVRDSESSF